MTWDRIKEQLNEVSTNLLKRYRVKAAKQQQSSDKILIRHDEKSVGRTGGNPGREAEIYGRHAHRSDKRRMGSELALSKITGYKYREASPKVQKAKIRATEETQIDEVSKGLIDRYIKKTDEKEGSKVNYRRGTNPVGRKLGAGYNLALVKKWGGSRGGVKAKIRATEEFEPLEEAKGPAAGQDTIGDDHIINQLRKAKNLTHHEITFADKKKHHIDRDTASRALNHYEGLKGSDAKLHAAAMMHKSHQSFHDVLAGKHATVHQGRQQPSMPHGFKPTGFKHTPEGSKGVAPAQGRKVKRMGQVSEPKQVYRPK